MYLRTIIHKYVINTELNIIRHIVLICQYMDVIFLKNTPLT